MIAELAFGALLAVFAIGLAFFVVLAGDHFAAVVGFIAYGVLLSLAWMVLGAPDVAMTEAALGGGVTGALLLGACARLRHARAEPGLGGAGRTVAAVFCVVLGAVLAGVVLNLPQPAPTLAPEVAASQDASGLGNPVTAVLMVFRALDTMLEKVVLLIALVAVWSLAPERFQGGRPVYVLPPEKSGPLPFLARTLIPPGIVTGVYLFWVGADDPGGAFAGGAVLSAMALLAFLAGVANPPSVAGFGLRAAAAVGVAVFLAVGLWGLVAGAGFLAYPDGLAKPVIVAVETAMTVSIAAILAMLVAGPPADNPSAP